ncbi:MAG: aspartate/glutamate racemase family protein [Chloroflexi bacterium]|nr:aspartate/glutamate racemase family protein [Chloroflexota bacterium]
MHKTIGILGGMSPESTAEYYLHLTRTYTARHGDHGYPRILVYSVSFQQYVEWMNAGQWDSIVSGLGAGATVLQAAGADVIIIATNTMHIVYEQVQAAVSVPVLSLLDAVGAAITAQGLTTVGLLGTAFTMEQPFYREALARQGITVLVPDAVDRAYVHRVVFEELIAGQVRAESRAGYERIIEGLAARGAGGIILGCTEIPLLIRAEDTGLPLFDTTRIHAEAALDFAVED